jgi:pimeloyl-ACP methyl ester carboxylesterase
MTPAAPGREPDDTVRAVRKTVLTLLLIPVVAYAIACLVLFVTQRKYIYVPVPRDDAQASLTLPTDAGDVFVSTRELAGGKAIVYFGGNAEDVSQTVPELAYAFPDRAIYALHYRSYGGSAGDPSEAALVADALALFDRVHATHADIIVIGRSLGSGVAVQVASLRPATRLVLVTPYASLVDVGAAQMPWFPVRWMLRDRFDSAALAPSLAMPTTLIVAGRDEVVPLASTRRLQAAFRPGVARWVDLPGEHHNFGMTPAYLAALASMR